jgi:putative ABC transport system permease protein
MNLAVRDIRHNAGRFVFTTVGIGLLLMIVMGMGGIYRGLIHEATLLVDRVGADLWVVQGSTRGPFAEISRISASLEDRVRAVPGVARARRFVSHTIQRVHRGRPLRMVVQGLSWPDDRGGWIPLVAGRALRQAHYEMIADVSLRLPLGEKITLGKDAYEVVGHTQGMVGSSGDGLAFFTVSDALAIQFDVPGEAVRLERAARRARLENIEIGRLQPLLLDRAAGPSSSIPALSKAAGQRRARHLASGRGCRRRARHTRQLAGHHGVFHAGAKRPAALRHGGQGEAPARPLPRAAHHHLHHHHRAHHLHAHARQDPRHRAAEAHRRAQPRHRRPHPSAIAAHGCLWLCARLVDRPVRLSALPTARCHRVGGPVSLGFIVLVISTLASLLGIWKALRVEPNTVLSA